MTLRALGVLTHESWFTFSLYWPVSYSDLRTPGLTHFQIWGKFFFSKMSLPCTRDFSGGSLSKESACNEGDSGSIPESGRSSRKGNGYPFQYSSPGNYMDRGAWQPTVHGVAESDTTWWLNHHHHSALFYPALSSWWLFFYPLTLLHKTKL